MPIKHIKKHPIKFTTAVVIMAVAAAAIFLPWKIIAQQKIIELLAQNGFEGSTLDITHIGLKSAQLEKLRLVKDAAPLFDKMTINFSPSDLLHGRVNHLAFSGLDLHLEQSKTGWLLNGSALKDAKPDKNTKTVIPVSNDEISRIGLDAAELQNSAVHIRTDAFTIDAPLVIMFQKYPESTIDVTSKDVKLLAQGVTVTASQIHMKTELNVADSKWNGAWQIDNIQTKGQDNILPTLTGSGNIEASANTIVADGRLDSADKTTHIIFTYNNPLGAPEKAQFRLTSAAMPWNKGVLSLKNTVIPLDGKSDLHVNLNVEHVPVNALMMMLTGKETNATGDVSGTIPVTLKKDGQIEVGQGKLSTEKPGVIALSPESIPGDNEQITLVRDIMKNLHYEVLAINVDSNKDHKLSILLAVEGNNPDVAQGRAVKLNVHLTGDLINFVQQSLLSLIDPKTFLKQAPHAQ